MEVLALLLYLAISIVLTAWVAHTLSKNGIVFLIECFGHDERLAVSTNHLLVVGFYLVNLGWILLTLSWGYAPETLADTIRFLSVDMVEKAQDIARQVKQVLPAQGAVYSAPAASVSQRADTPGTLQEYAQLVKHYRANKQVEMAIDIWGGRIHAQIPWRSRSDGSSCRPFLLLVEYHFTSFYISLLPS